MSSRCLLKESVQSSLTPRKMCEESEPVLEVISKLQAGGLEDIREATNYILSMSSQRKDLSPVAGSVVKLLAINNMLLKKVIYSYLVRYSSDIQNVNILASNNLLNDISDPNPHMRRLAMRTVCGIYELKEQALQTLPQALVDTSISVRRAAVLCCPQILKYDLLQSNSFVDLLYEMLNELDSTVVASCILALNEVLAVQGGVILNFILVDHLINKLSTFDEWSLSPVCSILKRYKPDSNQEIISFLNSLDDKLCDRNPVIFIPAMDLSLCFVLPKLSGLEKEIIEQIFVFLKLLLTSSNSETTYSILELIEKLIPFHKDIFSTEYKQLLCRFCDSPCIKIKKLSILTWIINEDNCLDICEELLSHCLSGCPEVRNQAVASIFSVLKTSLPVNLHCVRTLIQLMDLNYHDLIEEIINSFASLNLTELVEIREQFLVALADHYSKIVSKNCKVALLWLIGNYGKSIERSPYMIENIYNDVKTEKDADVMAALLSAAMKLFFTHPVEMQLLLGQIFQTAKSHHSPIIRRQADFYFKLLQSNVDTACKIVCIDEYV